MSLKDDIENLERERNEELRRMNFQFARTRRDIRNVLTPRRVIQRHPELAVMAAALAGIWLAPHLGHTRNKEPAASAKERKRGAIGALFDLISHRHPREQKEEAHSTPPKGSHAWLQSLASMALPILVRQLRGNSTVTGWLEKMWHQTRSHIRGNGHAPSAAGAGDTVAPASDREINPE